MSRCRLTREELELIIRNQQEQTQQSRQQTHLLRSIHGSLERIFHLLLFAIETPPPPSQLSQSAFVIFTPPAPPSLTNPLEGASPAMPSINQIILSVGLSSTASVGTLLADGTPSGSSYSNQSYSLNDPAITVTLNPDGTATILGVSATTIPISGSVSFTATDTDQAVSQWTVPISVTVNAVTPPPPDQLSQSAFVSFTDPA